MDIPRFPASASADDVASAIKEHGVAIVEELVDSPTLDRLAEELAPWIETTAAGGDEFAGRNTRRTGALLARVPTSEALIAHPLVLATTDRVLWDRKTTFQLHLTQAITIGPGEPPQYLHRDQWCFDFFPFPPDIDVELGTMWALSDFTEANGATRVVPGSHLSDDPRGFTQDDTVPAEMPSGSVVLYSGRTVHGGGANTTDSARTGVNVDYVLGWLRQEENQYLAVPPEVARTLSEPVQRLMGYSLGAYALGYVDDLRDPLDVLRGTAAVPGAAPTFSRD
jgi:ectoine hydroxylase-related dioxygenase (phytanoyl-CoA dioxygenase family)